MKAKNLIALLLVLLLLTGCGAASKAENGMPAEYGMMSDMASNELSGPEVPSTGSSELLPDRKLVRRVDIRAETEDLDALLSDLNDRIAALGGYIESQQIYNNSSRTSRNANLTIRIPAERLSEFANAVTGWTNVLRYTESQEDVTLRFVDTEGRLKALEIEQERLLALMEKTETMSSLLEIEKRLTQVRYELESVASQLRVISNQVDFATVELSAEQVITYTEVEQKTVWQRTGSGFMESLRSVGNAFVELFVWTVSHLPQLVILAAAALAVAWIVRCSTKKRKDRKKPEAPKNTEE